ncbi:hypothetical protein DIURU_004841 [Diutina rugosa]|uniref:Serine/threonine-protein phosphatase 4 regulatory subunit 3 n=1 Tax=Diutina rugosa TaxID=5481 RepID=A0A642UFD3_DIURU|nr:uncharacterized protein DIURU_004841 [Diutina rugosa]KAA8897988.1 hypothetical protein DIURU_004841 [Diutina rugosa]
MDNLRSSPVSDDGSSESDSSSLFPQFPRRVKVYLLQGEDWIDNGTGYCVGKIDHEHQSAYFLVRNEHDHDKIILKSYLNGNIHYQRQQETLIVWTDSSGKDLALSFQETEGCADLCDFIVKVQRESISPGISLHYVVSSLGEGDDITELITGPISYPPKPEYDNLKEVASALDVGAKHSFTRQRIASQWISLDYFAALIPLLTEAEQNQDNEALWTMGDIVRSLVGYQEPSVIDDFIDSPEKTALVAGVLEYDRECPNIKAEHRYNIDISRMIEVVPVDKIEIFQRDFRLQYLKNSVWAKYGDESANSMLSTMIFTNQMEIISHFIESDLLERLFSLYNESVPCKSNGTDHKPPALPVDPESQDTTPPKTPDALTDIDISNHSEPKDGSMNGKCFHEELSSSVGLKRNGIRMLHQYILMAKHLQSYQKVEFFTATIKHGLFKMVYFALGDSDPAIRALGIELTTVMIEQDMSMVHIMTNLVRANGELAPLYNILVNLLVDDSTTGLKSQAYEAIKVLVDPAANDVDYGNAEDDFKDYLADFYSESAPALFAHLTTSSDPCLLQNLCELTSFCFKDHAKIYPPSRRFFYDDKVLLAVAKVIERSKSVITRLAALRCLKYVISLCDNDCADHLIEHNVCRPIFSWFKEIIDGNGLATSSMLSFIDVIFNSVHEPSGATKKIADHFAANFHDILEDCEPGQRLLAALKPEAMDEVASTIDDAWNGNSHADLKRKLNDDEVIPVAKKIAL